ncbi:RecBCD enzyme subunit RecB [Desulfomarina profundi]|uniref:DNA 3'-5' helicase n=1 Tax=Desulfomarina profundi TaxID=2772557 RepID=A0A8D5JDH9_9BACT|nr:exodeoxyribonuclease V subunit beta [Desulfomarina profundi]BCL61128.1 RecBCD enzyme subunit RecB [Desulfomarina profundi]
MVEPRIFDPVHSPLKRGVNLVEASAGTGKTYAIAMLVLRAVVELEMTIDRILVVTFTRAAAEELRGRIRSRLVEGRDILNTTQAGTADTELFDEVLVQWAATVRDKDRALGLLELALFDIDRAGIFTIHGFCQRMLADYAMESGQLFDMELLADVDSVRKEMVDDFWRKNVYPLDSLSCALLLDSFADPEQLLDSVCGATGKGFRVEPEAPDLDESIHTLTEAHRKMARWWRKKKSELFHQLLPLVENGGFKKAFVDSFEKWWKESDDFFIQGTPVSVPDLVFLKKEELLNKLNGRKYRTPQKKEAVAEEWSLPGEILDTLLGAMEQLLLSFRVKLARELRDGIVFRLDRLGLLSFDDLIDRLAAALGENESGLRRVIRRRFTMALIDEFQDTDSSQWTVFSSLFAVAGHYLYLIGDPKQSIYRFRGADIHSYFLARERAEHHLTLDKNFRSHPFLVEEVNRIFSGRDKPFLLEKKYIEFLPVKSGVEADLAPGKLPAGLFYCMLPENSDSADGSWSSSKAGQHFLGYIRAEIISLLEGDTEIRLKNGKERKLLPKDIAILVRSNRQARGSLEELTQAGIPAVISSSRSVYESIECRELLTLLEAVAAPGDITLVKKAMALRWFGFSGDELYRLWNDEPRFSGWHDRFLKYNELWQNSGFLVMMNRLIVDEDVYIALTAEKGGERTVTNIQHLLEIVQELESVEHLQMGQILLRLKRMMDSTAKSEDGELRLETDAEAVRIITMHSAKGLEFPIVFCPWLWYKTTGWRNNQPCVLARDSNGKPLLDLGSEKFMERREQVLYEEMAEELRLLYVTLTRATIRSYVMWADVKKGRSVNDSFESALGYLLFPQGRCSSEEQVVELEKRCRQGVSCLVVPSDIPAVSWKPAVQGTELSVKEVSAKNLHTDWQMSSYSSLTGLSEYGQEQKTEGTGKAEEVQAIPVPGLPAGPQFGNIVHDILETIPFHVLTQPVDCAGEILVICRKYGIHLEAELLYRLLQNCVTTPVCPGNRGKKFTLGSLPEQDLLKEMEFYFQMSRVDTQFINSVLAGEPTVIPLGRKKMEGYLTGLMDLVCEFEGRFYIVDYKTNYLGDTLADYCGEKLIQAMASHNYGLQFWIYSVVLHRYLKNIVPSYSYQEHFGGVFYLFVRGMVPETVNSGVFFTLPDSRKIKVLERIYGGEYEG